MADCPHTIGVEFGTRIIEVNHNSQENTPAKDCKISSRMMNFFTVEMQLFKNLNFKS